MTTSNQAKLRVACPSCGARYECPASLGGRRGQCAKCGAELVIPTAMVTKPLPPSPRSDEAPPQQPALDLPEWANVECRVCQTLLTARTAEVGKPLTCPDCGAKTILPAPKPRKGKVIPEAMKGDQYELWGVDEAPLPSELIQLEPKYVALSCRRCSTLMQVTEDQVGRTIACPDCGTEHVVPSRTDPVERQVLAGDDLFEIEPVLAFGRAPVVPVPPRRPMLYEEEEEQERQREAAAAKRGKSRQTRDAKGRPIMPRQPLLTGIFPFFMSGGVLVRWIMLTVALVTAGGLMLSGLAMSYTGPLGAIAGMCLYVAGCVVGFLWAAGMASTIFAIIVESSEGNDRVHQWPSQNVMDWVPELLYLLVALFMSAFPGWALGRVAQAGGPLFPFVASIVVCLPIAILSQLDITSPWGVVSGRILASLVRCPFSWGLFYLEVALLLGVIGAIVYAGVVYAPPVLLLMPVIVVGGLLLWARLVGRLAWKLAETMATVEAD